MKRLAMIAVCVVLGCGPVQRGMPQASFAKEFRPLGKTEVITFSKTVLDDRGAILLKGTDLKRKVSRTLVEIGSFDMGKVEVVESGKKAYFVVTSDDPSDVGTLWVADGIRGKAYPLMKASSSFAVSPDGRYICFDNLERSLATKSDFPIVTLYDVRAEKSIRDVDYAEEKYKGTGPDISFDSKQNRFHLEFTVEDRTVGVGDIEVP